MKGIIPNEGKLVLLEDLCKETPGAPAAGPYNGGKLLLYTNELVLTPGMVLADLTEADFDGYTIKTISEFGEVFMDELNDPAIAQQSVQFNAAGTGDPDVCYGFAITDAAKTKLLYVEAFDTPRPMATAVDSIVILPVLGLA